MDFVFGVFMQSTKHFLRSENVIALTLTTGLTSDMPLSFHEVKANPDKVWILKKKTFWPDIKRKTFSILYSDEC